jgi:hypothetical protein
MKKRLILISLVCVFAFLAVPNVSAQKSTATQDMKFYLNLGVTSNNVFDMFHWQIGGLVDINLSDNLLLSPELMLMGYEFAFDYLYLYPGATVNLLLGKSEVKPFVGTGVVMFIPIVPGDYDIKFDLKFQGGLMTGNLRFLIFMWTPFTDLFDLYTFGAQLGIAL